MNKTLQSIIKSRSDLSPYLFHFTKGPKALETLIQILSEQKLRDVGAKGRICFTEAPLTSMAKLFEIFNKYPSPMYAPYGIAIERSKLFELGARPVIYGKPDELLLLAKSMRWRFEPYQPSVNDFTWLREWRINEDVVLNPEDVFVITKNDDEVSIHFDNIDVEIDGDWSEGEWHDQSYAYGTRNWKTISLTSLSDLSLLNDHQIQGIIDSQNIGDHYGI